MLKAEFDVNINVSSSSSHHRPFVPNAIYNLYDRDLSTIPHSSLQGLLARSCTILTKRLQMSTTLM